MHCDNILSKRIVIRKSRLLSHLKHIVIKFAARLMSACGGRTESPDKNRVFSFDFPIVAWASLCMQFVSLIPIPSVAETFSKP